MNNEQIESMIKLALIKLRRSNELEESKTIRDIREHEKEIIYRNRGYADAVLEIINTMEYKSVLAEVLKSKIF